MIEQRIDILDPEFRRDPYPTYAAMRRDSPVCRVEPGGMWAVSRHSDVGFVLKTHALFSSAGFRKPWEPTWVEYNPLARSMVTMDPPAHTRVRALVQRAFVPQAVARLEIKAASLARDIARSLDGELEAVTAVSEPLPRFMIGEILGFETQLHSELKHWANDILSVAPTPRSEEDAARIRASIRAFTGILGELVEARRRAPANDTVTDLVEAQVDGERLTTEEIVNLLALLLIGGMETTTHMISHALRLFSVQPDLFDTVRADPSCIGSFIEELVRYEVVPPMIPRLTTQDVELRGVTIPAGEVVAALIPSANRDEEVFENADRFDLKRGTSGLAFGLGHHFCIGAPLARMELRVMLTAILDRVKHIALCDDKIEYNRALTSRGPVALHLRFTPA
jgi:cytochrome P450